MLKVQLDIGAMIASIARTKAALNAAVSRAYTKKVYEIFYDLLEVSPQFSGDFTSNWRVLIEGTAGFADAYEPWAKKGSTQSMLNPREAGDAEAVEHALTQTWGLQISYRSKVFLHNATPLTFTGTTVSDGGETHTLRPENVIPGGLQMGNYLKARWGS